MARKNKKNTAQNYGNTQYREHSYGDYGYDEISYGPQYIQLPPIIQPIIMMPYGGQQQPEPQYDDYYDEDDDF